MRHVALTVVVLALVTMVAAGVIPERAPAQGTRPYEGTTLRAVVNAEYVKYSLSLVEKDVVRQARRSSSDVEVIPLDAFVPKTLLEFNSGSSPWDLVMFGPSNMPDYGRHFEPLEPWAQKLKLDFALDDIADVYKKLMLRHNGKLVSMPYDGDVHMLFWNKVAFERPDNQKKFKDKYKYDLLPPKTWKQWDDAAEFFHGWGWDGTDNKLFGAGASYKPSGSGYSYHWWRSRFFSYGGQYFDGDMKPLINSAAALRALEEMVRTMPYYPPGVLLFESEEPKTMLVKGEIPLLVSWTSTGKRVGDARESVIVGKAGFGLVPGADIDGKIIHRPAITPGRAMAVSKYSKKIRADDEAPGVHLAPRPEPEDRDGSEDHHGSLAGHPLPLREVPQGLPGRRRVPGRHREELPAGGAGSGHSRRGRVPAQALVRDHRGPGQAQAAQGGARRGGA